jgi:hypothetical protein
MKRRRGGKKGAKGDMRDEDEGRARERWSDVLRVITSRDGRAVYVVRSSRTEPTARKCPQERAGVGADNGSCRPGSTQYGP